MPRSDRRRPTQLRPIKIIRAFTKTAPGSVLISFGETRVLCTASFEQGVPDWKKNQGTGWVTAEYDMLPGATSPRRRRNRTRVDGRTQEIQRLIGRCLRAVVDFEVLGENTIILDCDVLQADGGTRTAAITGAYIALCDAVRHARRTRILSKSPINDSVAAVSVGIVGGGFLLDLDYSEDHRADVDMNVAMTGAGRFVEVQASAEAGTFARADLDRLTRLATKGLKELRALQEAALRRRIAS